MTDVVIFDLDGTLADITHRLHYIKGEGKKDWDAFHAACMDDAPIHELIAVAKTVSEVFPIHIVSGRTDTVRLQTSHWLNANGVPAKTLWMRKAGDYRPDYEVKLEILVQMQGEGLNPILAFDDRQQVVDMWRSEGIRCCQVAPGDF